MRLQFRWVVCLSACLLAAAPAAAQSPLLSTLPNGVQASKGRVAVEVTALTDSILRVRVARGGQYPENASWAVPAEFRAQNVAVQRVPDGFSTGTIAAHLDPATLRLTVNRPRRQGDRRRRRRTDPPRRRRLHAAQSAADRRTYFRHGRQDRRRSTGAATTLRRLEHRRVSASRPPPTRSTSRSPSSSAVGGEGGSYGLFLDNTLAHRVRFRPPRGRSRLRSAAPDGPIDYYVIAGPDHGGGRPPLYRPDRQGAAAAAMGARLPAVALQLHERRRSARASPRDCARSACRPT